MKKVVVIVLNNFKNDSRVLKESCSLQKAGYQVQVVALHEKQLKEFEIKDNILVHRVKLISRNWSKNKLIQLIKYLEFIYKTIKLYKDYDVFHCNDLNTLPVGVITKYFFNKNTKIVYDAHEYETETNGLKGFHKIMIKLVEKKLIKYADKVITVSDAIAKEYVKLYAITKPALVLNTPSFKEVVKKNLFREIFKIKDEQTIFLYQGALSNGRGIEILLEVFKLLDTSDKKVDNKKPPVIIFMGYGSLSNYIIESSKDYQNIFFHKAVSSNILLEYTSSADFGISTIEDTCLSYRYCLPNKIFEYIMAEIPIIVSNLYEMKRLVESNKVGIVTKANNSLGLKKAIEKAEKLDKKKLKMNIKKLKTVYNWENQESVLLGVYEDLYEN